MATFRPRLAVIAVAFGISALCGTAICNPARANSYAFGNTSSAPDAVLTLTLGTGATAPEFEVSTDGLQGSVSALGNGFAGPGANTGYTVGLLSGAIYVNYFDFDLANAICVLNCPASPSLTATVTGATLTVLSGKINKTLQYSLYSAGAAISELTSPVLSPNPSLYNALTAATNPLYASATFNPNTSTTMSTIILSLNSAAVADINTAITNKAMFGVTGGVEPVPEPSTWIMLLAGFAGLGLAARRRAARRRALAPSG